MRTLAGKCLCGAVQYVVADEFLYAANCHCSNCRRATGSAFKPFAGIEREKLRITEGEGNLMTFGDETGHDAHCKALVRFSIRSCATALSSMSPWVRWWTRRPSGQASTSSSARRRHGSRSPMICHNVKSSRDNSEG